MTDKTHEDSMHWVIAGALLLIGAFVAIALVMINSQANDVGASAGINNVSPTVVDVYMTTGADYTQSDNTGGAGGVITPINGGFRTVKVTGTVEDLNGAADVASVTAVFHSSAVPGNCSPDNNNCLVVVSCTTAPGPNGDQLDFNCSMAVQFYADSTSDGGPDAARDWVVEVGVKDTDNSSGSNNTLHKEMATLLAVGIPPSLNFGTVALGFISNTGDNQDMGIEQFGNDEADLEVSMPSALGCSVRGSIPLANVKWSLSDVPFGDVANTVLTATPTNTLLNLGYRTNDGVALVKNLHWNISVPTGVEGNCLNTAVLTAIPH